MGEFSLPVTSTLLLREKLIYWKQEKIFREIILSNSSGISFPGLGFQVRGLWSWLPGHPCALRRGACVMCIQRVPGGGVCKWPAKWTWSGRETGPGRRAAGTRGHSQLSAEQVGRGRGLRGRRVPGAPGAGSAGRGEAVTREARGAGEARGALGPALRRPPALGGAARQRDAAPWVSVQPAGRPRARPREESGCRPAGLGLHTSRQPSVDFSPGARPGNGVALGGGRRGRTALQRGRRAWASWGAQSSRLGGYPHVPPRSKPRRGAGSGDFVQLPLGPV